MGDMLYGIALAVGEVVHRVDAPLVAGTVMMGVLDTVEYRVTEHHIGMRHIYLRAEHLLAVGIFAGLHFPEEAQVLLYAAVAPRAVLARGLDRAAVLPHLLLGLVIDVCLALEYHLLGPLIELVEIIGSVAFLLPLESQPLDVLFDCVHIFGVLLRRIGVVVAEVGLSVIFLGKAEVYAETLGVAEVQIAVRLRRETGEYAVILAAGKVRFDDFFEEIQFLLGFRLILKFFHLE